ncbi:unnamed protein product [Orchesella dallaii]|uniref:Protein kinase domain-containing protein n=1 Tax=Orchesella dallaii TaxID=48710 RepID=A0ABP1S917_9HEXA
MEMGLWRLKNDADQNVTEESFEEKTNLDIYHRPIKTDGLTAIFFDHQVRVHLTPRLSSYSEQDVMTLLQVISTRFPTVITAPNSYFGTKEFSPEAMEWVPKVAAKLNKNNLDKKDSIEKPISILFSFYQLESPEIPRNSSNSTPVLDLKIALEVAESANEIFPGTVTTLLFDGFRKVDKIEHLNQLKTGLNSEPAKRAIQKGIKIGTIIDLRTCQKFNSSVFAPITEKVELFIIDVKDSKAVARHPISILRKRIFDAGICMRFLKGLAPDVKVMVSVNCKEIATVNSVAALEDISACVHMVSEWGKENKIGVVMPQAFDVPSAPDGSNSFPDKEGGWWKLEKKTEQDLNVNLFVETLDEFLREQIDSDSSFGVGMVFLAICIVVAIALLLLATAGVLTIWVRRKQALLSGLEMDEFFNGVKIKAAASSLELKDVDDNIFMRLKYSRKKFEIKKREFHFDDSTNTILGEGNYGVVHKLKLSKFPNHVAVKIPKSNCTKETLKSLLSEIKIMSYVGVNEYVVQFLGAYTKEIQRGIVYIVTELCENGCLLSHLGEMKKTFAENKSGGIIELTRFCREIAAGMNFIAEKGVIHGDLSTRNVLLDSNETCKICDFGLSKKLYQYKIYTSQQPMELPWRWLAIESLKRFVFSVKSDVWGYGVTVWEIFSFGDVPYPGQQWDSDFVKALEGGLRMKKPKIAPAKIYSTMVDCWNIDPEFRPTFEKLVELFEVTVADYENV